MAFGVSDEGKGGGIEDAVSEGLEVGCYPVVGGRSGGNVEGKKAVECAVAGELRLQMRCGLEESCVPA